MVCPKCGVALPDDAVFCAQCGASMQGGPEQADQAYAVPPQYAYTAPQPPMGESPINSTTYLIFAIIVTIMCCLPFGIPAIIYATKIDKSQAAGDYAGAVDAAKKSKMWSIIAAASLVVLIILYVILIVAVGASAFGQTMIY